MFTRKKQKKQTRNPYKKIRKPKPRYKTRKQHGSGFKDWFKPKQIIQPKESNVGDPSIKVTYMLIRHAFSCNNLLKESMDNSQDNPTFLDRIKGAIFLFLCIVIWVASAVIIQKIY